jgi:hypothetical protein
MPEIKREAEAIVLGRCLRRLCAHIALPGGWRCHGRTPCAGSLAAARTEALREEESRGWRSRRSPHTPECGVENSCNGYKAIRGGRSRVRFLAKVSSGRLCYCLQNSGMLYNGANTATRHAK